MGVSKVNNLSCLRGPITGHTSGNSLAGEGRGPQRTVRALLGEPTSTTDQSAVRLGRGSFLDRLREKRSRRGVAGRRR